MILNSRYHLFLTLSFYVKLAQKQIDDEIWQLGLFFFIKEYCNTTFLRLFVCQYFHENLVLFLPQVIKSGDDDFISPLSRITNVAAEHIWVSHIKKIFQGFNCSHSFMIPYSSCWGSLTDSWLKRKLATNINSLGSRTHALELTRIALMITGLFYLSIMICHHVKKRYKGLSLSCPFWVVRRRMER